MLPGDTFVPNHGHAASAERMAGRCSRQQALCARSPSHLQDVDIRVISAIPPCVQVFKSPQTFRPGIVILSQRPYEDQEQRLCPFVGFMAILYEKRALRHNLQTARRVQQCSAIQKARQEEVKEVSDVWR